jgi:aldose 1-epimerase
MRKAFGAIAIGVALAMCMSTSAFAGGGIEKKHFGTTTDGKDVDQYTLDNGKGGVAKIITYGGTVTSIEIPDKNGKVGDVVLGFDNLKQYEIESPFFGAIIGRVGNRIAKGMFTIDGNHYAVPVNNGPNHLHGGFKGYDKRVWAADTQGEPDGPSLRLKLDDADGTEGYPGNVHVTVIYSWSSKNVLKMQYYATTDQPTPINLTNHTYFNLKDAGKSDILGHVMQINADGYTPVDDTLIPTGEIAPVKGTPIDFTTAKPLGKDMKAMGGDPVGYDHNLVLRSQDGSFAKAADVYEPESGRRLEVWTTEPGVQLYTGNFLDGSVKGKHGTVYQQHNAFCLETQHYPDSINHPKFPSTLVHPHEVYRQVTEFRFFVGDK